MLAANLTLIVLSVGLSVGYLALNNRTAARGFMVRTVEKRIAELRREADRLDMQVVAMQSMGNIEGQVGELGLVPVEGLDYISAVPAAVAVSHGNDLTRWDLVAIPRGPGEMWGESAVVVSGRRVTNIARFGAPARALVSVSDDDGRTWTPAQPANLPMAPSKPYAGTLSTGQHFLIGTQAADGGNRRSPLTLAVSRPGEPVFSRLLVIRDALCPAGAGESHAYASLAYPYAVEHNGQLYVGYSNSGGRGGPERAQWNNNSAELAVMPVAEVAAAVSA